MNRGILTSIGLILVAILVTALNVMSNNTLRSARVDLSAESLYTLSDGTRNVLRSLEEPVTLRFYFSQGLANGIPQVKNYGLRVRELVEEYVNVADGMVRLEVIDPEPFTDAEDDAVRAGLQAFPLTPTNNLYFGLIGTNTVDDREVIAFFQEEKEQFLEYELTRLVYNLSDPKKIKVGLITSHEMNANVPPLAAFGGQGPQPWAIVEQVRATFELKQLENSAEDIPKDIDVLWIAHPGKLKPKMLYAIDQYVLAGGRALIYVDPFSEVGGSRAQRQGPRGGAVDSSYLPDLFKAWGVSLRKDVVVGDIASAQRVNAGTPGNPLIIRYLPWIELSGSQLNGDDVVTTNLGSIKMVSAGNIVKLEDGTTEYTPLITSSDQSAGLNAEVFRRGANPERMLRGFKPTGDRYVMAARVTGNVKSAYPNGPPKEDAGAADDKEGKKDDGQAAPPGHLSESAKAINVIIVADSDMLYDQFWAQPQDFFGKRMIVPTAANADMLINALDNLAGSNDLIGLRSRGRSKRPFEKVDALRVAAEQVFLEEEKALRQRLGETQKRLNELQTSASAGGGALLTEEQQQEIDKAQVEILKARKQLRGVQHNLNKDIEALEAQLKFANIGMIPLIIAIIAVGMAAVRYQRRRRRAPVSHD